ncbi:MAG: hypothetical protein LBU65_00050 [Planctomycetaceae bacterium]|nr:hypothetical protein [Planctomycetaceae bacterium]
MYSSTGIPFDFDQYLSACQSAIADAAATESGCLPMPLLQIFSIENHLL